MNILRWYRRRHWIGKHNLAGYARYWWYKRKGRIVNGNHSYYIPGLGKK